MCGAERTRACHACIAQSALCTLVRCRADTCVCLACIAQSALRTYVRCRADTCVSRLHVSGRQSGHVGVSPAWREALSAYHDTSMCSAGRTRGCLACIARSALRTYVRCRADTWVSRLHSAKCSPHVCALQSGHVGVSPAWREAPSACTSICGAGRTLACLTCIVQTSTLRMYVRCRADACVTRLHSAKRSPHVCAVQSEHVGVSPIWRKALSVRMCGAELTHVCLARIARWLSSRMCGAERTRGCPTCIARSALRTYVRCRADTWVSRLHSAKRSPHVYAAQSGVSGHVRVSPAYREALSARMCGAERTRGCIACIARSALRTYVRCRADACVSCLHSAKRSAQVCAVQGGRKVVSPAWREALSARMCGAGRTLACLACIARSALRTYVRCRADAWVSRPHGAKRSPHVCAVQGGHVVISPV
jgi:hypothetical protein